MYIFLNSCKLWLSCVSSWSTNWEKGEQGSPIYDLRWEEEYNISPITLFFCCHREQTQDLRSSSTPLCVQEVSSRAEYKMSMLGHIFSTWSE